MKRAEASSTALVIAASLVLLRHDKLLRDTVPASTAELAARALKQCSAQSRLVLNLLRFGWFRRLAWLVERLTIPGIFLHYAMRKKCIAKLARDAVANGAEQLIILGAGFDSLGRDLANEFPNLRVWELDHPATQKCKASAMASAELARFQFVPVDFSVSDLEHALRAATGFEAHRQTVWVAEGLLMYFDEATVRRLLQQAASVSARDSRFIFTFMQGASGRHIRFQQQTRLVDWWLDMRGEPFHWGISPEELPAFTPPWRTLAIFGAKELQGFASAKAESHLAVGEMICLAEI